MVNVYFQPWFLGTTIPGPHLSILGVVFNISVCNAKYLNIDQCNVLKNNNDGVFLVSFSWNGEMAISYPRIHPFQPFPTLQRVHRSGSGAPTISPSSVEQKDATDTCNLQKTDTMFPIHAQKNSGYISEIWSARIQQWGHSLTRFRAITFDWSVLWT